MNDQKSNLMEQRKTYHTPCLKNYGDLRKHTLADLQVLNEDSGAYGSAAGPSS